MIDYSKFLNNSIQEIKPSGIRKFFDIASEMDDVISLSIGEPDFQTPWHIREEGINSLKNGKTWYSPNRGFAQLREEIANYYARRFKADDLEKAITDKTKLVVLPFPNNPTGAIMEKADLEAIAE